MKYLSFCCLFAIVILAACHSDKKAGQLDTDLIHNPSTGDANAKTDYISLPVIAFDTLEHDFGKINEGDKATFEFKFKNTGKGGLLISDVAASCGCTTPYFPKNVIMPGKGDAVKVVFDSNKRPGSFVKTVTVTSNTYPNQVRLIIRGTVIAKDDD
jgi:hypothetical protein